MVYFLIYSHNLYATPCDLINRNIHKRRGKVSEYLKQLPPSLLGERGNVKIYCLKLKQENLSRIKVDVHSNIIHNILSKVHIMK